VKEFSKNGPSGDQFDLTDRSDSPQMASICIISGRKDFGRTRFEQRGAEQFGLLLLIGDCRQSTFHLVWTLRSTTKDGAISVACDNEFEAGRRKGLDVADRRGGVAKLTRRLESQFSILMKVKNRALVPDSSRR
jgi:hypothetical protein